MYYKMENARESFVYVLLYSIYNKYLTNDISFCFFLHLGNIVLYSIIIMHYQTISEI